MCACMCVRAYVCMGLNDISRRSALLWSELYTAHFRSFFVRSRSTCAVADELAKAKASLAEEKRLHQGTKGEYFRISPVIYHYHLHLS